MKKKNSSTYNLSNMVLCLVLYISLHLKLFVAFSWPIFNLIFYCVSKKPRIWETNHLLTDADSSTNTKKKNASKAKFTEKKPFLCGDFTTFKSKSFLERLYNCVGKPPDPCRITPWSLLYATLPDQVYIWKSQLLIYWVFFNQMKFLMLSSYTFTLFGNKKPFWLRF